MSVFIRLLCLADGSPSEHDGRLVSAYDPNYAEGLGRVWTTDNPYDALTFADVTEAHTFWVQVSTVRPVRDDGEPNRPLTAFTISVEDPERPLRLPRWDTIL